ncbi:unnamed protein product [Adineta steineri]|uniref:Uncharacterized protein n=1 Tax=Adineta steineri TaxID=433720 RepID=A0A818Q1K5_9BILA|nr:unnamed protein product [Adineta steineri]CAF3629929.1 unnamed protein product [Adineta steineri]CAF3867562.1 unnamed protein product [Adineta steineri]
MAKLETSDIIANIHCSSSGVWSNCQPNIQRRINALLNYQAEYFRLRMDFHRELQELQYKYSSQFEKIFEKQRKIIDGSYELSEFRNDFPQNYSNILEKGIPNFWLTVLKNLDSYDYPIRSKDELCLKYLRDIRCILNPPNSQTTSFLLEFHFLPSNPFFTETILTKYYSIRFQSNDSNPYQSYDGPEVDYCQGCSITWTSNHNLTIQKRNRRIRNKTTGAIRFVQVEKSIKSFFDFFSPPIIPTDGIHEMIDEDQIHLEADIEFGLLLKQRILPKAVLYYTGEGLPVYDDKELTSSDSSQ